MIQILQKRNNKKKNVWKNACVKTGTIGQLNIYLACKENSGWCLYRLMSLFKTKVIINQNVLKVYMLVERNQGNSKYRNNLKTKLLKSK